jgi:hypothetical protein
MENMAILFGTQGNSTKFGHCVFMISSREQVAPGSSRMLCKANKCNARFALLITPKFCLVGFYNFAGPESEAKTLGIFEDTRLLSSRLPHYIAQ